VSALAVNLVVAAALVAAAVVSRADPDLYYRIVQEDDLVEWATFWAFALAAVAHARAARRAASREARLVPFGVAAFCALVALEEISWGQRLLGYRPPTFFLENNDQLELNLHNVVATSERKLLLWAVIAGYGLALPALSRLPRLGPLLRRLGASPSLALAPASVVLLACYAAYPWDFTGEWIELCLGLGFLLTAGSGPTPGASPLALQGAALLATLGLGAASAAATRHSAAVDPLLMRSARREAAALRSDLQADGVRPRCGLHKRLYTWARDEELRPLTAGRFAGLVRDGLPEDRARFLLDPWNSPWWVRYSCDGEAGRRLLLVYSFGPNRRRDSDGWSLAGDDVGAVVRSEIRER